MPTVTVLMSVYNGAKYLRYSIETILTQTFSDFEFIIVDDGSIDQSLDIAKSYRDNRIRILRNRTNLGLTRSLNKGLNIAKGQYVARMDADDISEPERLEKQVQFLTANPRYVLVGSRFLVIDADDRVINQMQPACDHETLMTYFIMGNPIAHGSAMFRNCFGLRYNPDIPFAQDYDLWTRISRKGLVANLPCYLYRWRTHTQSICAQYNKDQTRLAELIGMQHMAYLMTTRRYDLVLKCYLMTCDCNLELRLKKALMKHSIPMIRDLHIQKRYSLIAHSVATCGTATIKKCPVVHKFAGFTYTIAWLTRRITGLIIKRFTNYGLCFHL
jgi:glycosyltransferase involved in cell wall biosynthesis